MVGRGIDRTAIPLVVLAFALLLVVSPQAVGQDLQASVDAALSDEASPTERVRVVTSLLDFEEDAAVELRRLYREEIEDIRDVRRLTRIVDEAADHTQNILEEVGAQGPGSSREAAQIIVHELDEADNRAVQLLTMQLTGVALPPPVGWNVYY